MSKKLNWNNRWVEELNQNITYGSCENEPFVFPDNTTPKDVVFRLTETEWVKLFSCIMTGADIEYPEQSHEIMWSWLRQVECPIDICDLVAECIRNNQNVQDALAENREINNVPSYSSQNKANAQNGNILAGIGCDPDEIYGAAVAMEDYIRLAGTDVVENIVAAVGDATAILQQIDNFPLIGDFPVTDDFNDFVTWLKSEGLAAWANGYDVTIRQENICAFYEQWCSTCFGNITGVMDVYIARGSLLFNPTDTLAFIMSAMTGTLVDEAFVASVMALVAGAMGAGGTVGNLTGLAGLRTIAATGTPSDDHELFCSTCVEDCSEGVDTWSKTWQASTGLGTWVTHAGRGSWNGDEWEQVSNLIQIKSPVFPASADITSITIFADRVSGDWLPHVWQAWDGWVGLGGIDVGTSEDNLTDKRFTVSFNNDRISVGLNTDNDTRLVRVCISGTGADPFA